MDDLYDNLENYNEVNLIQELRTENEELKAKVENYTVTLDKLQKDFDKLAAEYKTLELNYSSLLKTARAEVERKTQIIASLNQEKDMMVLNAIQNKNVLNVKKNWSAGKQNIDSKDNEAHAKNKKMSDQQPKSRSSSAGRKEASQTPSEETTTTTSAETARVSVKNEKCGRASDAKENLSGGHKPRPGRPAGIRSRRKSMPAASFRISKFSSDEEGEISSPPRELPRELRPREPAPREEDDWRNDGNCRLDRPDFDPYNRFRKYDNDNFRARNRFEGQRHRFSPERLHRRPRRDFLGDPRQYRQRDSSGGYKSDKELQQRPNKRGLGDQLYRDSSGGYKSDKDGQQRSNRRGVGDQLHRDSSGGYKSEKERHNRGLGAQPYRENSGGYKSDKELQQRPNRGGLADQMLRDSTGGYKSDRELQQRPNKRLGDQMFRDRSDDHTPRIDSLGDHNSRREDSGDRYQRPEHRKRRLESPPPDKYDTYHQKNHEQFEKDYNDERNKLLEDPTKVKYLSDYDEPSHKRLRSDSYQECRRQGRNDSEQGLTQVVGTLQSGGDMSCQSPDYLCNELASTPKEIKLDAEVKLDDPREHSNKYIVRTENGEKVISTVSGSTIYLKPVTKSVWPNLTVVKMPADLVRPPRQITEELVSKMRADMDVDEHGSDISVKSADAIGSLGNDMSYRHSYKQHKNEIAKKDKMKHPHENNKQTMQAENNEISKTSGKDIMEADNVIEDLQKCEKAATEKNVIINNEKEPNQMEEVSECPKIDESQSNLTRKMNEYSQTHNNVSIPTKKVEATPSCNNIPTDNEHSEETTQSPSNIWKTKYKIPKRNKDKSGINEQKRLDNREHDSIRRKNKTDDEIRKPEAKRTIISKVSVVVTGREMVEGDLELSDDNSDNIELMKHVAKDPIEQMLYELNTSHEENKELDKNNKKTGIADSKPVDDSKAKLVNCDKISISQENVEGLLSDTNKGKSKNKSTKSKAKVIKEKADKNKLKVQAQPKLLETVSKEIKHKFCDLFGDTSSSLITPEDLGLTTAEVRIESSSSNYFPSIFEDAQDAIDVGAKVMGRTKLDALPTKEQIRLDNVTSKNIELGQHIENQKSTNENKSSNKNCEKDMHNNNTQDQIDVNPKSKSKKLTDNEGSEVTTTDKETKSKESKNKNVHKRVELNEDASSKLIELEGNNNKNISAVETKPSKSKTRKLSEIDKASDKQQQFVVKTANTDEESGVSYKSKLRKVTEKERFEDMNSEESKKIDDERIDNKEFKHKTKPRKITDTLKEVRQPENKITETDEAKRKTRTRNNIDMEHIRESLDANEMKSKEQDLVNNKNAETEDLNPQITEIKRRKSKRNEEKAQLTVETADVTNAAAILVQNMFAQRKDKQDNNLTIKEPVVKTVVISSGMQPVAEQVVNNFSPILLEPPITPNIDKRQTKAEIPILTHSVHIHALATSTPAKEMRDTVEESRVIEVRTPDVSNASDQTSQSNVSHDMDAPDVRIFVKRRRRVIKKTTPSKT